MNGDRDSRGMAPSSSSTKAKQDGSSSTDKKPSTDSRGHGSSRDYPVRSHPTVYQWSPLILYSAKSDATEAIAIDDVPVLQDIEAPAHLAAREM